MKKSYKFANSPEQSISFETSNSGEINAEKYTLLEILGDAQIENLSIDDRISIVNSWSKDISQKGHPFSPKVMHTGCKTSIKLEDSATATTREFVNYGSNDYLNLSHHPEVTEAAETALHKYGGGTGAAGVVIGVTDIHDKLHKKIASFKGTEASLVQSNGYLTNLGVINALMGSKDLILFDMYSHASLVDGVSRSNINKVFFDHNNMTHLEFLLKRAKNDYVNKLIVIEGVYSMDGDIVPLDKVYALAQKYGAKILVDEAHSTGVIGKTGRGITEHFDLMGKIDLVTGTFSKALGSVGGYVAGKKDLIEYLYWANRSFVFSTSMYIPCAAGVLKAFEIIENDPSRLEALWKNVNYVKAAADQLGLDTGTTNSAIIPIILGEEANTMNAYKQLNDAGIFCIPVTYPAVAKGQSRLRISITAEHSKEQLDQLIEGLTIVSMSKTNEDKKQPSIIGETPSLN